jgi:hypothetical protein
MLLLRIRTLQDPYQLAHRALMLVLGLKHLLQQLLLGRRLHPCPQPVRHRQEALAISPSARQGWLVP